MIYHKNTYILDTYVFMYILIIHGFGFFEIMAYQS